MVKTEKKVDKKPRVDKRKNVWEVAKVLIKSPNKTEKEIAEETWLWAWTVHRAKKELEKNGVKDPTINFIVGSAKDYLKALSKINTAKIDKEVKDNLVENKDGTYSFIEWKDIHIKDIVEFNKVGKEEMARLTVLWWDVTDDNGWLKDMSTLKDMTLEQLDELRIKLKK